MKCWIVYKTFSFSNLSLEKLIIPGSRYTLTNRIRMKKISITSKKNLRVKVPCHNHRRRHGRYRDSSCRAGSAGCSHLEGVGPPSSQALTLIWLQSPNDSTINHRVGRVLSFFSRRKKLGLYKIINICTLCRKCNKLKPLDKCFKNEQIQ